MRKSLLWMLGLIAVVSLLLGAACNTKDKNNNGGKTPSGGTPAATSSGEVPGVSDTEVVLGAHTSLTGPIAAYNIIPNFTKAYFDHLNATQGGINGRKITYLLRDDAYSPPQAVSLTHQLVEQDHIFAMFNALGTPNHLAVIDYLQQRGVPDMFVATGAIEWVKDPSTRPFVFGSNPNYTGEGLALGKWIRDTMGADTKVGVLYQNDDFGIDGLAGVKLAVGADAVVAALPYEATDPDVNSQIDQLKAANADVVVGFATPLLLALGIKHARSDLGWDVQFAISAVSMNELTAILAGGAKGCGLVANTNGCLIEGTVGPVATYMVYQTNIPAVQAHVDLVNGSGIKDAVPSGLTMYAQYVAELMAETLRLAGVDLTRAGLIAAAESIKDFKCSVCLFPVTLGPDDHDPAQRVAIGKYTGGKVVITSTAYSWEGVSIADLKLDSLKTIDVPADALAGPP